MTTHRSAGAKSAIGLILVLFFLCPSLSAKTLEVGPAHNLKAPSDAASVASPGDVIEIDPGEYFDCAVWSASGITIEGRGDGTIITDKTCEGKALFVTRGNDITIRNLTFSRARVPDANGAGIRAEGKNLTIERSRFIDNENGILAGNSPESRISISGSEFLRNGKCAPDCSHGIYVGHIALLRVEGSKFLETKQGHHIKSRALRTELVGNDIRDGKDGTASYLVEIPNGGSLVMDGNVLQKGPNSENHTAAIMIGAEGVTQPTRELSLINNNFTNDGVQTLFVKNLTATEAVLSANTFKGKVIPLSGDGVVR
jgi:Right handed beta helix region